MGLKDTGTIDKVCRGRRRFRPSTSFSSLPSTTTRFHRIGFLEHNQHLTMASRSSEQHSDNPETPEKIWSRIRPTWKGLFGFTTRAHIPTLVFGVLTALLAGCVTPALAIFLGNLFDTFTTYGAGQIDSQLLHSKVASNCLRVVAVGVAGWLLNGAYFTAFVGFGELQAFTARSKIFSELLYRDVEWFEARREGSGAFLSSVQA